MAAALPPPPLPRHSLHPLILQAAMAAAGSATRQAEAAKEAASAAQARGEAVSAGMAELKTVVEVCRSEA